eukprot:2166324-Pyramimonas_sp.AAC.2
MSHPEGRARYASVTNSSRRGSRTECSIYARWASSARWEFPPLPPMQSCATSLSVPPGAAGEISAPAREFAALDCE